MRRSCTTCRWSCPVDLAPAMVGKRDSRDQNRLLTVAQKRGAACLRTEPWFAMPPTGVCPLHEGRWERYWAWLLFVLAPWVVVIRLRRLATISLDILAAVTDNGSAARCAAWSAWRGLVLARAASDVLRGHVPTTSFGITPSGVWHDETGGSHVDPEPAVLAHAALRTAVNAALMEARAAAWHPGLQDMLPSSTPSDLKVPAYGSLVVVRPEVE
jgi:hypothetical protein